MIAFDAVATTKTGGATSLAWNHTVAAGNNRILIVGISFRVNSVSNPAATYNSIPMTLIAFQSSGSSTTQVAMFYLLLPDTGTHQVSVTWTTSSAAVGGSMSFTGVKQSSPYRTPETKNGGVTGDPFSVDVTSAVGELVVDVAAHANDGFVAEAGQTARYNDFQTSIAGGGSTEPGAASVNMGWNPTTSTHWAMIAISLIPGVSPDPLSIPLTLVDPVVDIYDRRILVTAKQRRLLFTAPSRK